MGWATPRDIALIFLSLQAIFIGLVPLLLLSGLIYATIKARIWLRQALRQAFGYLELGRQYVERGMKAVAAPVIGVYSTFRMVQTILMRINSLVSGGKA